MTRLPVSRPAERCAVLLLFVLLSTSNAAWAELTERSEGGNWGNSSSWSNGIPSSTDYARILAGAVTVDVPGAGAAYLEIQGGGVTVQKSNNPLALNASGSLSITNLLSVGSFGNGTFNVDAGGNVGSGGATIGFGAGGTGFAEVNGSENGSGWSNFGGFAVGVGDTTTGGELRIVGGGRVTSNSSANGTGFTIGSGGATGTVTVDNSSLSIQNFLEVGAGGLGYLTIQNGATVQNLNASIGYGNGSTSSGTDSVGSVTMSNATWTNGGTLDVGAYAHGTLLIAGNSTVTSAGGNIGLAATGNGAVSVDHSTWTNAGELYVGREGEGKLELLSGATVASGTAIIGRYGQASGLVIVDHSTWTNDGDLYVAHGVDFPSGQAAGQLQVINGGTVATSSSATLGYWSGSIGTARVTGVIGDGTHSSWTIVGDLTVGARGVGTLTVADGGIVRSASTYVGYNAASLSSLNLEGTAAARGVLETGQVSNGTGAGPKTGKMNFDGGILRATGDQPDLLRNFGTADVVIGAGGAIVDSAGHDVGIATPLQGNGGLTKVGAGTLDLAGDNIYGGLTSVDEGKLLVNVSVAGDALVKSGATLGGSGNVRGTVTVAAGGILSPGNSPGTLRMGGLTLAETGVLAIDVGAVGDLLVVDGDVVLDGVLNLVGGPGLSADDVLRTFILYTGTLVDHGLVIGTVPEGFDAGSLVLDLSRPGVVGLTSVPLPPASLLLATALLGLRRLARRQALA